MHGNQTLEDDSPCRVPESVLQGAENLANASLARMRGYKDMLDVLRLRGSSLRQPGWLVLMADSTVVFPSPRSVFQVLTCLDLGCALDGLFEGARHDFSQVPWFPWFRRVASFRGAGIREKRSGGRIGEARDQRDQAGRGDLRRSLGFASRLSLHTLRRWAMGRVGAMRRRHGRTRAR